MPKSSGTQRTLDALRQEVEALGKVFQRQARRPFVLEITGTPKAGKTTLIAQVDGFLRQCGWRVHVLEERAGICQLPMKGHFFFNTWTTGTMLAGLLDAIDRDHDVVILDRGLFDALVWLQLQSNQGQVSKEEAKAFREFVSVERWRALTDSTLVVEVPPRIAMLREGERRLLPRRGSVMNERFLREFNAAVRQTIHERAGVFNVFTMKNDRAAVDGSLQILNHLVARARAWVDPKIAVVRRETVEHYMVSPTANWSAARWAKLAATVEYRRRSSIEEDDAWVQLLACGVQVHAGKVFLSIRRRQRGRAPSSRDDTGRIWQGCHIAKPPSGALTVGQVAAQLRTRLQGDLHLGQLRTRSKPVGFLYLRSGNEVRHLGLMFKVPLEDNVAQFLDEKEFKTNGRGHTLKSSFVSPRELRRDKLRPTGYKLEAWSEELLVKKWVP